MVVGEARPDGTVKILGIGEQPSVGIRKGEIIDYKMARACVKEALLQAEDVSDVDISGVFLAVTGSHITGVNNRGTFRLRDEDQEITKEDVEEAKSIAKDIAMPSDNVYIHSLVRHYWIDGSESTSNPVGLYGRSLDADFHLVYGIKTRIQNSVRCAREMPLDVEDVVFSPIAAAQLLLTRENKESGALVLDLGGGTTDYVLYLDGAVAASGCIAVGGYHISNDIHVVTKIPFSKAEQLKQTEGDVSGEPSGSAGTIRVTDDKGFAEHTIERETLNGVITYRLEETLELVKDRLPEGAIEKIGAGVYVTGGTSCMRGFKNLAMRVFGLPIFYPDPPEISGSHSYFEDPRYSTALGLIRYAQLIDEDLNNNSIGAKVGDVLRSMWPF